MICWPCCQQFYGEVRKSIFLKRSQMLPSDGLGCSEEDFEGSGGVSGNPSRSLGYVGATFRNMGFYSQQGFLLTLGVPSQKHKI